MRWFWLATPIAGWATQLVIGSQAEELACGPGQTQTADTRAALAIIGTVALVLACVAGVSGLRARNAADGREGGAAAMVADATVATALLFGMLIAFGVVQLLVLDPCAGS